MTNSDELTVVFAQSESYAKQVADKLYESGLIDAEKRDSVFVALVDIAESVRKIYAISVPDIAHTPSSDVDRIWDVVFDLRAEFRHIAYHIDDADLDAWSWPLADDKG